MANIYNGKNQKKNCTYARKSERKKTQNTFYLTSKKRFSSSFKLNVAIIISIKRTFFRLQTCITGVFATTENKN